MLDTGVSGNLSPSLSEHIEDEAVPVDLSTPSLGRSTRTSKEKTSIYNDYET